MDDPVYCRIFGYTVTLVLHIGNTWDISNLVKSHLHRPEIQAFQTLMTWQLTTWNITMQIIYAAFSLYCELATLYGKNKNVSKIRYYKDIVFTSIETPVTLLIFTIFWSFYLYDSTLVIPPVIDEILNPINNHIAHSFILTAVIWEVIFMPRTPPSWMEHSRNLFCLAVYSGVYSTSMLFTHDGLWVYPYMERWYGTYKCPLFIIISFIMLAIFYIAQWKLSSKLWNIKYKKNK